ncbi:D-alanyl-D-alanine carboxypeptidase/D-alanyl-D-alanine-endopeptidase [Kitasatospora sp. GP82]|uniref:D-alanyl-D-alanine carboxypeptidase/D-alanyl-D-alanine endopeptidase n=1 Tax=Kitasatospora sp. GP82 TaxID=3035089 RepID=UPI002473E4D4|nr:D-alanyl-D-alanine carboxypeptidase/D-alanyl-D-alanine-endopeptidase [Kitasatospora sp. GP82]MDH6128882.1 D-alanyl-D-alanine carboxypeptidase/D-alanyl-D-alanine-endopeptidase (penicillin-binding protein 4) [Kitasatospora sp. GP82]
MHLPARLHRRTLPLAAVALATSVLAGSAQADSPSPADPTLAADIDTILANPVLAGAESGVEIVDLGTGKVVYQHQADAYLTPASTMKTITSAAALDLLGPDYKFTTEVRTTGARKGAVLNGDLVLRGGGDPSLLPQDLDDLAAKVAAAGITKVNGRVLADGSRYDNVPFGPGWAWDDQPYSYSPQISGLTVATDAEYVMDTVKITVTPGKEGEAAKVSLFPAEAPLKFDGQITTGAAGSAPSANAERRPGVNVLALTGSIPAGGAPVSFVSTIEDPTRYTGQVFAGALARHGVTVGKGVTAATGRETSQSLAGHDSRPLSELLPPLLKLSNNGIAEHLTKEMGKVKGGQGSWTAGVAQIGGFLNANGLAAPAGRQVDGSGLSRYDLVTAGKMTGLLKVAANKPWFKTWYEALPIAGNPARMVGGTLATRMQGTPAANNVHAKSGSMGGVDNLSGYATAPDGRRLAFTVMVNNYAGSRPRAALDAIAVRLASGPAKSTSGKTSGAVPAQRSAPESALMGPSGQSAEVPPTRWEECETLGRC